MKAENRLESALAEGRRRSAKGLAPYVTAGDGGLETTLAVLRALAEVRGVACVELGLPFSDPIADGPVLQAARARARGADDIRRRARVPREVSRGERAAGRRDDVREPARAPRMEGSLPRSRGGGRRRAARRRSAGRGGLGDGRGGGGDGTVPDLLRRADDGRGADAQRDQREPRVRLRDRQVRRHGRRGRARRRRRGLPPPRARGRRGSPRRRRFSMRPGRTSPPRRRGGRRGRRQRARAARAQKRSSARDAGPRPPRRRPNVRDGLCRGLER